MNDVQVQIGLNISYVPREPDAVEPGVFADVTVDLVDPATGKALATVLRLPVEGAVSGPQQGVVRAVGHWLRHLCPLEHVHELAYADTGADPGETP